MIQKKGMFIMQLLLKMIIKIAIWLLRSSHPPKNDYSDLNDLLIKNINILKYLEELEKSHLLIS